MPASPVTRRRPVPVSRWRRTAASSGLRPRSVALDAGRRRWAPMRRARGRGSGAVAVHGLDEELEGAPGRQRRRGEHLGDGGVGDAGLAGEGAQGRPAGAVVEVVEGGDEVAVRAGWQVGAGECAHRAPAAVAAIARLSGTCSRASAAARLSSRAGHGPLAVTQRRLRRAPPAVRRVEGPSQPVPLRCCSRPQLDGVGAASAGRARPSRPRRRPTGWPAPRSVRRDP